MVVILGEEFVLESIVYGYLLALIEKFGLDEKKDSTPLFWLYGWQFR